MNDGTVSVATALLVATPLLTALAAALAFVFKLYAKSQSDQLAEMREQRDSFRKGYERSVESLEAEATKRKQATGEVVIPVVRQTKAESNSPTTERQQFASDIESLKAREEAAKLALTELPPPTVLPAVVNVVEIAPAAAAAIKHAVLDGDKTTP